jgi:beta-lactamase regulating signal transducer with metallopeptidase domain
MLHALFISVVESAIALGLVASTVTALRLSAKLRFQMWATVLVIALAGFGASLIASNRTAPATAAPFDELDSTMRAVLAPGISRARQMTSRTSAANEILDRASDGEPIWKWAKRIWLLGVVIYVGRILVSLCQTIGLRRGAKRTKVLEFDPGVSELLSGLPPGASVVALETVRSPIFLGFGPPLIVLPKTPFEDFSSDDLRFIIAHELEHWRRRDDYVDLASRVIAALLWPNPSVHLARRLMIIERECACDHAASRVLRSGVEAANSLWQSAQIVGLAARPDAIAALGSSSQLVTRIHRLISPRPLRDLNSKILLCAVVPLVAMAILIAAIASPGTAEIPRVNVSKATNHVLHNGGNAMNDAQWAARKLESGEIARREKRLRDARADFGAAAAWYATHGPVRTRVHALTRQAQIERDLANYEAAIGFQQTAVQLQRKIGPEGLAHVVRHLADILNDAGRHRDARSYYAEMESLYRSSSATPPLEMANAIRSLAVHAEHVGDKRRAQQLWIEARDRYSKLDEVFLELTGERRNPGVEEAEKRLALF